MTVDLQAIFNAGRIRRWHARPELSWTDDYLDGHQGRCARLALALFPDDRDLRDYLLTHDDGESATGDIPWDVKRRMSAIARGELVAQDLSALRRLWGSRQAAVSPMNLDRATLCDRLDAYMWATHKAPHVLAQHDFREMRDEIEALAIACNVADAVMPVIGGRG